MSSILIVGADHLGGIADKLEEAGFRDVRHLSGRKCQSMKWIPQRVDCVLVLTDYINHNLCKTIKQQAKEQALPVLYAKRSWSSIRQALQDAPGLWTGAAQLQVAVR